MAMILTYHEYVFEYLLLVSLFSDLNNKMLRD